MFGRQQEAPIRYSVDSPEFHVEPANAFKEPEGCPAPEARHLEHGVAICEQCRRADDQDDHGYGKETDIEDRRANPDQANLSSNIAQLTKDHAFGNQTR